MFPVEIDTLKYSWVKATSVSIALADLFLFTFKIPNKLSGVVAGEW
jgi:hypothetical protein